MKFSECKTSVEDNLKEMIILLEKTYTNIEDTISVKERQRLREIAFKLEKVLQAV